MRVTYVAHRFAWSQGDEVRAHEGVVDVIHGDTGLWHLHHAHVLRCLNLLKSRNLRSRILTLSIFVVARLSLAVCSCRIHATVRRPKRHTIVIGVA